ncbi:MAG: hypothetical protein DI539_26840, partial [Flavobacterium psychrophilum]
TNLTELWFNESDFTGPIPSSIGNLTKLQTLNLQSNRLEESIPSTIGNLVNLEWVALNKNKLNGKIPNVFSNMSKLDSIWLDHNQLTDSIPSSMQQLSSLARLSLNKNQLTGKVPTWLSSLSNLRYITLDSNRFTSVGTINFQTLPSLKKLTLNNNLISVVSSFTGTTTAGVDISNNLLDFSQLTPLKTISPNVTLTPQRSIQDIVTAEYSCLLKLSSRNRAANASIVWQKENGTSWTDVTSLSEDPTKFYFQISNASQEFQGKYKWIITDPAFPGIFIESSPIVVTKTGLIISTADFTRESGASTSLDQFKLSSSQTGVNYKLRRNNIDVAGSEKAGTGSSLLWPVPVLSGTYSVNAYEGSCNSIVFMQTIFQAEQYLNPSESNENFIKEEEMLTPDPINTSFTNQKKITYQYMDGLGRPIQMIDVKGSFSSNDVVAFNTYDEAGRKDKQFEPYTSLSSNGLYKTNALGDLINFYSPQLGEYREKVKTDDSPFVQIGYESSPLNRPISRAQAGANWKATDVTVRHEYVLNKNGISAGEEIIPIWQLSELVLSAQTEYVLITSGNAPSQSLYVNSVTDENGNQMREYINMHGKAVVKQVQYSTASPQINNNNDWAITTYVFDDFDRLRFVLQPEFQTQLSAYLSATNSEKRVILDKYAFEYRYDEKGRLIYKKLPGTQPVDMVYDNWHRLILSRSGTQKLRGKWSFTKYDALNREIIQGEITSNSSQQTLANAAMQSTSRFESAITSGVVGYSLDQTFPTVTTNDVLAINYYDDYSFITNLGLGNAYNYSGNYWENPTNQVTGSKHRVLDSSPIQ